MKDDFIEAARQATAEDRVLNRRTTSLFHRDISKKPAARLPGSKVSVNRISLIEETLSRPDLFIPSTPAFFWEPVTVDLEETNPTPHVQELLETVWGKFLTTHKTEKAVLRLTSTLHDRLFTSLYSDTEIDMVTETSWLVYRSLWDMVGLPTAWLGKVDFNVPINTLKSISGVRKRNKKQLETFQISQSKAKLLFLDRLVRTNYREGNPENLAGFMKQEGFSELETTTVLKTLFISEVQPALTFLPRLTALLIKTRYLTRLNASPELTSQVIEEAFRVTNPVPPPHLVATAPYTFNGLKVQPQDTVMLNFAAAAVEEGIFNPDTPKLYNVFDMYAKCDKMLELKTPWVQQLSTVTAEVLKEAWDEDVLSITQQSSDDKSYSGGYKELRVKWVS